MTELNLLTFRPAFLGLSSISYEGMPHIVLSSLYAIPEMVGVKKYVLFYSALTDRYDIDRIFECGPESSIKNCPPYAAVELRYRL